MQVLIDRSKASPKKFLEQEGWELDKPPKWEDRKSGKTFVVLARGFYEEGVIAFSKEELEKLLDPADGKEKRFFVVSTWKLFLVADRHFEGLAREHDLT